MELKGLFSSQGDGVAACQLERVQISYGLVLGQQIQIFDSIRNVVASPESENVSFQPIAKSSKHLSPRSCPGPSPLLWTFKVLYVTSHCCTVDHMQSCPLHCISSGSVFTPVESESSPGTLGRWVRGSNLVLESDTECQCIRNSPPIRFLSESGVDDIVSLKDLASMIGFIYSAHVVFESDSDIRSMHMWEPGPGYHSSNLLEPSLHDTVALSQPHSRLSVRFINHSMGYGLFADGMLPSGCLVCEYTGVVRSRPSCSAYAVSPTFYFHIEAPRNRIYSR